MLELKEIKQEIVYKKTGEVLADRKVTIRTRPNCPFRSITDLKGYRDAEVYHPDDSILDEEGYEPLSETIRRCTVERHGKTYVDISKLPVTRPVYYDPAFDGKTPDQQAAIFDDVVNPPIEDLEDLNMHVERVANQLNSTASEELSTTSQGAAPHIASADASAVGNSVTETEKKAD